MLDTKTVFVIVGVGVMGYVAYLIIHGIATSNLFQPAPSVDQIIAGNK